MFVAQDLWYMPVQSRLSLRSLVWPIIKSKDWLFLITHLANSCSIRTININAIYVLIQILKEFVDFLECRTSNLGFGQVLQPLPKPFEPTFSIRINITNWICVHIPICSVPVS